MKKIKQNVSSVFLVPCLKIREETRQQFDSFGYVNSYLFCDKCSYEFFTPIYLLFEPENFNINFYNFTLNLERNQNHVETIDLPKGQVLFVFRIPKRFESDYEIIKQGRYSKTSPDFKACFPVRRFVYDQKGMLTKDSKGNYATEYTMYFHIFNKTEFLRSKLVETLEVDYIPEEMELHDKYDERRETLNY